MARDSVASAARVGTSVFRRLPVERDGDARDASLVPTRERRKLVSMGPSRITLVAHTHWDREWYQPFEVFRAHLVEMLDEALDHLERDPRLSFTLDGHVALVDDYLELRPVNEPRIRALVQAGRLHIGPWYTQADTLLADGESLIRNLALGVHRAELLGGAMRLGYMPDQFGHAAQLPQLLRQFDIDGAVLWRGVGPDRPPHAFRWVGPDGSAVTALWLQDGYASGRRLPSDPDGFADAIDRTLERLGSWAGEMPVLFPVGDDHVKLAVWLPEAAEAVRRRHPEMEVALGGYHQHLPKMGVVEHTVRGELRSPAFAPVLAGVASARIREKQMAFRGAMLLQRYAEPLWAMARQAGAVGSSAQELIARAWRQLMLNHAHDSIAGCGIDESHEDVKARFRWAEQLAAAARDQALAQLRVDTPADAPACVIAFQPGPSKLVTVEAQVPRALGNQLIAVGPDGVARPAQPLAVGEAPLIFEGEFPVGEIAQYMGGLDPRTPLFGKFLSGITASEEAPGVIRLDVGLGEHPAPAGSLEADQKKLEHLMKTSQKFHIVMHGGAVQRPVLVQAGGASATALVPIVVRPGEASPDFARAGKLDGETGICAGPLRVVAQPDGTVLVRDDRAPLGAVRANDLVDDGDRGDLYHFDGVGASLRARTARARVTEEGPLRARLVVEQELELPTGLTADRSGRATTTRTCVATTEITLIAGDRKVDFRTSFDNQVTDHRLRALVHAPMHAERLDVEHGLAVLARPLDPSAALGAGTERPATTGQHHGFVDVSDGKAGVALMSRGLPEHEVMRERDADGAEATRLALTLVRSVGWLSRGDLKVIDHAAGPMVPTPGAQEPGPHVFEYALVLHEGDWLAGQVMAEARRYQAPAIPVTLKGRATVPAGKPLVDVTPATVVLSAVHQAEGGRGLVVRLLNGTSQRCDVSIRTLFRCAEAIEVNPLEQPVDTRRCNVTLRSDGTVALSLGAWQLATILLR
jgi:alpha-mannosidase